MGKISRGMRLIILILPVIALPMFVVFPIIEMIQNGYSTQLVAWSVLAFSWTLFCLISGLTIGKLEQKIDEERKQ